MIKVSGWVQGVGFRYSAQVAASARGLTGWVRNLSDGSVHCLVQGPAALVLEFCNWISQGPAPARISQVEISELPYDPTLRAFRILH